MFKAAKAKTAKQYKFVPQPDITAYELARLLLLLAPQGRWVTAEDTRLRVEALPPEVKRHIVEVS